VRVATFNVQHARRPDGVVDVALLARTCAALEVDVLAIEEVDRRVRRSGWRDLAAHVASACGMRHVLGAVHRIGPLGRYGNALLSRRRIGDVDLLRLPGDGAPRGAIVARTADLSVAVTHLSRNRERSAVQLDVVCDALLARPGPHVLLGDLNRRDHEVGRLAERGFTVAGGPPTYPAGDPRLRIDHVAVTGLAIVSIEAPPVPVSDHRPLVVEVEGG
jgi:endonuclease/exonuclease/phosphatase family metal-dependent hydrolase